ncbi:hypothetical protein [Cupriavidus oxalaticus]|uniref:Uncharacterized protein n=1 Tax=Cupriavidus oxalaticus TaxID=96344 RepID=A0A5P3VIC9_9BURK|nr:hypothetical protein [Cupriavidus oxalaticus]QEZ45698.1 hypothetical protein D2917_15335 [Cupriavidus oxalaticus]
MTKRFADDLDEDMLAQLVFEGARMESDSLAKQVRTALEKRDKSIAELRAELAALHSEVKALKSDMRKRAALSDEAHRCSLVRERAQEAEARLTRIGR